MYEDHEYEQALAQQAYDYERDYEEAVEAHGHDDPRTVVALRWALRAGQAWRQEVAR